MFVTSQFFNWIQDSRVSEIAFEREDLFILKSLKKRDAANVNNNTKYKSTITFVNEYMSVQMYMNWAASTRTN